MSPLAQIDARQTLGSVRQALEIAINAGQFQVRLRAGETLQNEAGAAAHLAEALRRRKITLHRPRDEVPAFFEPEMAWLAATPTGRRLRDQKCWVWRPRCQKYVSSPAPSSLASPNNFIKKANWYLIVCRLLVLDKLSEAKEKNATSITERKEQRMLFFLAFLLAERARSNAQTDIDLKRIPALRA
jgi:hypothetical protein